MREALISTRVPAAVLRELEKRATDERITVSKLLRRIVTGAVTPGQVLKTKAETSTLPSALPGRGGEAPPVPPERESPIELAATSISWGNISKEARGQLFADRIGSGFKVPHGFGEWNSTEKLLWLNNNWPLSSSDKGDTHDAT